MTDDSAPPRKLTEVRVVPSPHLAGFSAFLSEFNKELSKESDRGLTLIACSFLDSLLFDILKAFLVEGNVSRELLNGFNAPLGTFSTRISAAFSLGLISEHEHKQFNLIRRVRNRFAHHIDASFDSADIRDLCKNLKDVVPDTDARGQFTTASVALISGLTNRAFYVGQQRRQYGNWKF
jgi:mannitol operon repressor